jgi:hypothetical protein
VSAARLYDYLLGGKDNFEVDRVAAEKVLRIAPYVRALARSNRRFLHRAVRHLVRDCGIRQFIDLGTGIPTSPSVHDIARAEAPEARVVYIDNDPVVTARNRAILATDPDTITLLRDLRDPDSVLDDPTVRDFIDFRQPVGLLFVAVLHFVAVDQAPAVLCRYRDAVAPGSGLAISALCREQSDPTVLRSIEAMFENSRTSLHPRSSAQIEQLFEGFEMTSPIAPVMAWGRPPSIPRPAIDIPPTVLAGVGLKQVSQH